MRRNLLGEPISERGEPLGCEPCPLNKVPGLVKIFGLNRIAQRKAFLWAQCPGPVENKVKHELRGNAGNLLWKTLEDFHLFEKDFDVQNVVRCLPPQKDEKTDTYDLNTYRNPTAREIKCCSVYNQEALDRNHGKAQVHVILGEIARRQLSAQLLGPAKKERMIYWHKGWGCYIVINHHPSYILQLGGEGIGMVYYLWRDRFRAVRHILKHKGQRWGYLKAQNYHKVMTLSEFDRMEGVIRKAAKTGRVSFDIEDGIVGGKPKMLLVGFGTGHFVDAESVGEEPEYFKYLRKGTGLTDVWKGECFSVVIDHPAAQYEPATRAALLARLKTLVEDPDIRKSMHNGSYDVEKCKSLLGFKVGGYDYDTMYGTYLRYSYLRSCGLENLGYLFFPEFCDYKEIVDEKWKGKFGDAPLDELCLRNCGDCDLTQRLEQRFESHVNHPLLRVYMGAGKTLDRMEKSGPLVDFPNWEAADKSVPSIKKQLDEQLQQVLSDAFGVLDQKNPEKQFDADSSQQVAHVVYDIMKLPVPEEKGKDGKAKQKRTTVKTTLEYLQTVADPQQAKILAMISRRRAVGRMLGTYIKGFKRSAQLYKGRLHTIWWLTGTVTGRLRSGKGDRGDEQGIINLQNLANSPLLQNLICSDRKWRDALK